jgi:cytochrome c biogenesis protein CcdA
MFIALGAAAAWFGTALIEHRRALEIAGGIFVVFAGLVFAGVRLPTTLLREQVSLAANRRSHCAVAGRRRLRRRLDAVRRPDARRDPRALGRRRQP